MSTRADYAKTVAELVEKSGESRPTIMRAKRSLNFPAKGKSGWNVAHVVEFINEYRERAKEKLSATGGTLDELKAEKLQVEIDIAKEKLAEIRRQSMPMSEVEATVDEIAAVVLAGLDEWVQWVGVEFREAKVLAKAEACRDRLRAWWVARFGKEV